MEIMDWETVERVRDRYEEMNEELEELRKAGNSQGWDETKTSFDEESFGLLADLLAVIG